MKKILFYKNYIMKQIHDGDRVDKYMNHNGEILQVNKKTKKLKEYIGNKNSDGYLQVNCNLYKTMRINRLVALLFIGEPPCSDYVVDHIDGNRLNNNYKNLRWCSVIENQNNPITRKRKSESKTGKNHPQYTLVEVYFEGKLICKGGVVEVTKKLINELGYRGADKWFSKRGIPKKYLGKVQIVYLK